MDLPKEIIVGDLKIRIEKMEGVDNGMLVWLDGILGTNNCGSAEIELKTAIGESYTNIGITDSRIYDNSYSIPFRRVGNIDSKRDKIFDSIPFKKIGNYSDFGGSMFVLSILKHVARRGGKVALINKHSGLYKYFAASEGLKSDYIIMADTIDEAIVAFNSH